MCSAFPLRLPGTYAIRLSRARSDELARVRRPAHAAAPLPESAERCDTVLPILMADEQLARVRRLAAIEELLPALVGVLDLREVLTRVSEVAGRVLEHDAIALP